MSNRLRDIDVSESNHFASRIVEGHLEAPFAPGGKGAIVAALDGEVLKRFHVLIIQNRRGYVKYIKKGIPRILTSFALRREGDQPSRLL